jgi:hypothetical protein
MKQRTIAQYKAELEESESERINLARECSELAKRNTELEMLKTKYECEKIEANGVKYGLSLAIRIFADEFKG